MEVYPTKLAREADGSLAIEWSDGQRLVYSIAKLREQCPCATCREQRSAPAPLLPVLKPQAARPLTLVGMKPVGNYAYSIEFSDGHGTGIYTLDLLRQLGREAKAEG